uniref:RagB/SusD family nutrient uptake outer membrane protein n=1 Tax=Pedobacter schmidteae TaxID=2201271 RepID=UPI000EADBDCC|nr:RagB/SusD family nutrient uptake outer membrane protein [Pedobacter schmidteae]
MKLNILKAALIVIAALSFSSCKKYLDMSPTNAASDKLVWSKVEYAEMAINSFYHDLNYFGNFSDGQSIAGMTEGFTDIFKYSAMTYNAYMYIPNELAYGGSVLTPGYVAVYLGNWSPIYERVRRVNEALANLKKYGTFSDTETKRLEAELKFFRGQLYFDLVKRYKQVIIYDEDLSKIQKNTALSTEAAGWDFVEADLNFAGQNLVKSNNPNGRVTSGAAYALLSRAMLYAERWESAKSAGAKVMAMGYELTASYADAFKTGSTEAILQYSYNKTATTHAFDATYAPGGDRKGTGGMGTPTQELVESYELKTVGGFPDWSAWHNTSGTSAEPPYANLEPRFQATVLYNGAIWKGRTIEPFVDGKDGWASWKDDAVPAGRTVTGYYLKKLLDENLDLSKDPSTQPWTAFRLGEVLLNYAEACYRANASSEANAAVRKVRARVGLPYTDKSGTALMAAIMQERKVELAFEGYYYWDMKRWKLAETAFTGTRVHGLKIEKLGAGFKYTYVDCDKQDRNFPAKMYRIPLPTSEFTNNTAVKQFPEWN